MTESPERISLDEWDGLRTHLILIQVRAAHLAKEAERVSVAVGDLPKRPEWTSEAEGQIDAASAALKSLLSVVQSVADELAEIKTRYLAKQPFI